jgi:DMSO/TMAO reductase YedYZ molybdopterin-dependent catalytic subunit
MQHSNQDQPGRLSLTRRSVFQFAAAAGTAWGAPAAPEADPLLQEAIARLEYLTPVARAVLLDKGKAGVANLPVEKLREIGLTPETWSLEVIPDPASNSAVEQPLSRAAGNALDWNGLMKLAAQHAVRFVHPCICTNGDDPYHVTLWEGVPLREVIGLTRPKANIRRVYYQSYHPEGLQPFQSSLPLGQILETPPGQMPVILAYKMNGQPIPVAKGGPVRMVVPAAYGSKSTKWVERVVLTNDYRANDSDAAEFNNDVESAMKTKARFVNPPREVQAGKAVALTGMALVGVSGIRQVQYCVHDQKTPWPADDPYWTKADWKDAAILPPPAQWGGGLPEGKLPLNTGQMDPQKGTPLEWPVKFSVCQWAALMPGLPAGSYDLCCRTIDGNGIAQPMPRTLLRTGANAIHRVTVAVR